MPSATQERDQQTITVPSAMLREMIERTVFAVSSDETRLNLSGIFVERPETGKLRMVATDGHRLSMITRAVEGGSAGAGVIIPRKGVAEISKVLESGDEPVTSTVQGGVAHATRGRWSCRCDSSKASSRTTTRWCRRSRSGTCWSVSAPLLAALRRVSIVSSERTRGVKLQLDTGKLEISSINPDVGEASEEIAVDYEGRAFSIGFNAKYLIDVLAVLAACSAGRSGLQRRGQPGGHSLRGRRGLTLRRHADAPLRTAPKFPPRRARMRARFHAPFSGREFGTETNRKYLKS